MICKIYVEVVNYLGERLCTYEDAFVKSCPYFQEVAKSPLLKYASRSLPCGSTSSSENMRTAEDLRCFAARRLTVGNAMAATGPLSEDDLEVSQETCVQGSHVE